MFSENFLVMYKKSDNRMPTLHCAVAGKFTNLVLSLLERSSGELVNMQDKQGRTPLHLACYFSLSENFVLLDCLLGNLEDLPCRKLAEIEKIILMLLSHGADPQILDEAGKSPFHLLITSLINSSVNNWNSKKDDLVNIEKKIIDHFLQYGVDINIKDAKGRTPLHYVAGSPEVEITIPKEIQLPAQLHRAIEFNRDLANFLGHQPILQHNNPFYQRAYREMHINAPAHRERQPRFEHLNLIDPIPVYMPNAHVNAPENQIVQGRFRVNVNEPGREHRPNVERVLDPVPLPILYGDNAPEDHERLDLEHIVDPAPGAQHDLHLNAPEDHQHRPVLEELLLNPVNPIPAGLPNAHAEQDAPENQPLQRRHRFYVNEPDREHQLLQRLLDPIPGPLHQIPVHQIPVPLRPGYDLPRFPRINPQMKDTLTLESCEAESSPTSGFEWKVEKCQNKTEPPLDEVCRKHLLVYILNKGAKIDAVDDEGRTPLHLAVVGDKCHIVEELLIRNANVNVKDCEGQTPLHHGVSSRKKLRHCGMLLLKNGALASIKDNLGATPANIARDKPFFSTFIKFSLLFVSANMHPEFDIPDSFPRKVAECNEFKNECGKLDKYFENCGCSQLATLLQNHRIPIYTKNEFFASKINDPEFGKLFPNYCEILRRKFSQDTKRMEMIEYCALCIDHLVNPTSANQSSQSHWEGLPEELKLKILSYLCENDLEFLQERFRLVLALRYCT